MNICKSLLGWGPKQMMNMQEVDERELSSPEFVLFLSTDGLMYLQSWPLA